MFPNFDTEGNHVKAMLDRTILLPVMLFAGVCCCGVSAGVPADVSVRNGLYGTLLIDGSVSPEVTPVEYGFHYEEIGMMGEGALYAELVRNRSFEEATPPADLSIRKDNTPADPGCVAPVRSSCRLDLAGHIEVAPLSLAIYRFK